jgi:hypothetical protein
MSVDLIVYFRRAAMPSPAAWRQAILAAGFPVELDDDFDPDTSSGFRPCKLRGVVSGFEYFAGPVTPAEAAEVGAPGADFSVTLVTHSDLLEFACSAVAAGVLAQVSSGVLIDPQSGETFSAADGVAWAAERFAEVEQG